MRHSLLAASSALLIFVGAIASATPATPEDQRAVDEAIEEALQAAMAEAYREGPYQADWNKGGVDLKGALAARPGGVESNFALLIDKEGEQSVISYGVTSVAGLIPAKWNKLADIGNIDGLATAPVSINRLEGRFAMVLRGTEKRVGDAFCDGELVGAQLYDTGAQADSEIPPKVVVAMFKGIIAGMRDITACARYDTQGAAYRVHYFLENGHSLPALDESEDTLRIVPAAPIEQLLTGPNVK